MTHLFPDKQGHIATHSCEKEDSQKSTGMVYHQ